MASFPIQPISRFHGVKTSIKRPFEIAHYSVDRNRQVHVYSDEQLRFYYPPFFPELSKDVQTPHQRPDLSTGFDKFIKRDESVDEHLDGLLDTLIEHETRAGEIVQADVVAFRGQITKIMTSPFDRHADFEMNATCYQGAIYIEENLEHRDNGKPHRTQKNDQAMFQYWGYKFESLATLPRPWSDCSREEIESRDDEACDNIAEYCSVVRTSIGVSNLVIGGEVDCVLGGKPEDPSSQPVSYIELKTSKRLENDRDALNFEQKMCRFWAQSFLLGVPTIVVGWRSRNGYLLELEEISTQKIPGKVKREGRGTWDGNICINFTAAFLDCLKATLQPHDGNDGGVWRVEFKKGMPGIGIRKVEATGTGRIIKEEFKRHREKMAELKAQRDKFAAKEVLDRLGR
ncbi:putative Dhp1-interacting protein Din1 [Polychaeton citri CBS 116435]|uniref:Decapping nuclease n=1 Tax=Polychaeton citri CBS 116435 TaxID=1314669 RepID=A0A9P4ULW7_9PEZI|nr:putative Dhp1-interacting protein Din1 [Polychaeton citri CBS 116435]